jgi:hypothetical protein
VLKHWTFARKTYAIQHIHGPLAANKPDLHNAIAEAPPTLGSPTYSLIEIVLRGGIKPTRAGSRLELVKLEKNRAMAWHVRLVAEPSRLVDPTHTE